MDDLKTIKVRKRAGEEEYYIVNNPEKFKDKELTESELPPVLRFFQNGIKARVYRLNVDGHIYYMRIAET